MSTTGRPTVYSVEVCEVIFDRMSKGESILKICNSEDMPTRRMFYKWMQENEEMRNNYARACEARQEYIFEELFDIADDGSNDLMTITKGDISYEQENKEVTNRSRLRVDTRKWILARMNPKKYGDKVQTELSGEIAVKQITGMEVK